MASTTKLATTMRHSMLAALAVWFLIGLLNLRASEPRAETGPLAGIVVDASSDQPIPRAEISGVYRHQVFAGRDLKLVADEAGKFRGERALHRVVLYGRSHDGQLAGLLEIGPDDAEAVINVRPLGKARGQIIDEATGQPLANRKVNYGVRVHIGDDDASFRICFGGSATTDDMGYFELTKLIARSEYHIDMPTDEQSSRETNVGTVTVTSPETKQLGKLKLKKPYQPPTLDERIVKALAGDPQEKYETAKKDAQSYRQRVGVLLVDPTAVATRALMQLRFNDKDVRKTMDHYQLVVIDATSTSATDLAATLNVTIAAGDALPQLVLRDAQGTAVMEAEARDISLDGKIDKTRIIDLLRANAIEPLDARKLLDEALLEARKSNRRVLVQQTAVWCGPCHLLAHYLERQRATWEKDYIWIRIDERWTGSREVMDGIKNGNRGGIPWIAILDADGRLLTTSNGPKEENIGFPSTPQGIEHFMKMLKDTAQRLTDDDLRQLRNGREKKDS